MAVSLGIPRFYLSDLTFILNLESEFIPLFQEALYHTKNLKVGGNPEDHQKKVGEALILTDQPGPVSSASPLGSLRCGSELCGPSLLSH